MNDYTLEDTIYKLFTTRAASGVPTTLSGTPVVSAYENDSLTQITAGITLGVDHDGVTGLNLLTIVATAANGYEDGKDYGLVITTGTVDSVSVVGEMVKEFSLGRSAAHNRLGAPAGATVSADIASVQSSVDNISTGSAAISTIATSFTKAGAEPETLTYTATHQLDLSYHEVEDDATSTDVYYEFSVGGDGVPVEFLWDGYAQSNGDTYTVYAYNWGATSWDQVGSIAAANGTAPISQTWQATVAHVGVGANSGLVRLRFLSTDGTKIATDRVLCSYAVVARSVGYAEGAIWIDTAGSNTGTESFVDGTADNPVSTWAAALTISGNLGLVKFQLSPESSITLTGNSDNFTFVGVGAAIALAGQSIEGAVFEGANISGTGVATTTLPQFKECSIGTTTLPPCYLYICGLDDVITVGSAGDYYLVDCFSQIPGASAPEFDMAAVGATNLSVRRFGGGLSISNIATGDVISAEATVGGTLTLTGTAGTVEVRGGWKAVSAGGFSGTVTDVSVNTQFDAVPTATENADALLNRDMSAVSDTTARSPLNALRFLRNKWSVTGTTLTVTEEDDTTAAWTAELSTDAAADPVTGSDPA